MKTFKIPLIDMKFYIYVGDNEYDKMITMAKRYGHSASGTNISRSGYCIGQYVWVKKISYLTTIFHELSHLIDNLCDSIGCSGEAEFRAYITEYIYINVFDWWRNVQPS